MDSISLHQFLVLYSWFPLIAVLLLLMLIARFYQKFSGIRTFFSAYALPIVGYGVAAIRYAALEKIGVDSLADILSSVSGLILLVLVGHLTFCMLNRKQKTPDGVSL